MRKVVIYIFFFLSALKSQGQSITFGIPAASPKQYQIFGTDLDISVYVGSTYQLTDVTAFVNGISNLLYFNSSTGQFGANFPLAGLPEDTLALKIVATDIFNNKDSVTIPFIHDLPPVITIESPVNWSTARPTLPLKAKCTDNDGHCNIQVTAYIEYGPAVSFGTFPDSINTILDFSPYDRSTAYVTLTSVDSRNQQTVAARQFYTEFSPYLEEVVKASDNIMDFNFNKIYVINSSIGNPHPNTNYILDINTHDSIPMPMLGSASGLVTPYGAFLLGTGPNSNVAGIFDFNKDSLFYLGSYSTPIVAGNFGAFIIASSGVQLRDFSKKTDILITSSSPPLGVFGLADNGTVAYETPNLGSAESYLNIYQYKDGVSTKISDDSNGTQTNGIPLTDGKSIIYQKQPWSFINSSTHYQIYLYTGSQTILLSEFDLAPPNSSSNLYQINNGYTAYTTVDYAGNYQVWIRDSAGNSTQRSIFGSSSRIDMMDGKGNLIFTASPIVSTPGRYFSSPSDTAINFASVLGTTYCRNNLFYIAIGRTLFKVNIHIPANNIGNSSIRLPEDSVYSFKPNDFVNQFQGPGQLIKVKITSLPDHGLLKLNGTPVTLNQELFRSDLVNLTYTPDTLFKAASLEWNGSNGVNYTSSNGTIQLSSVKLPPVPIIINLLTSYCSNSAIQTIKITNLPSGNNGITAVATIDKKSVPIRSDSTFSLNPADLSAGTHKISVHFETTTDTSQTNENFVIQPTVTPKVELSYNQSASNTTNTVTIMAKNTSVGGKNPLYTFSTNHLFTDILKGPGTDSILITNSTSLHSGNNWFYVKMQIDDSCYTSQTATDSINISSFSSGGLIDPDFPNSPIKIFPNPFVNQISVTGLQTTKAYDLSITDIRGQQIIQLGANSREQVDVKNMPTVKGVYFLKIYDKTKGRIIGVMSLLKKD